MAIVFFRSQCVDTMSLDDLKIYWHGWNIFSCDQAALGIVQSVCLSVTPFWLCSHHHIIMKFTWVITNDRSDVHAKCQGQRSKVKVTEVENLFSRFWIITPVWIHIWWNDAQCLMLLRRGALLLFFKVIHQISRSHGTKKSSILTQSWRFWTVTPVWIHWLLQNDSQSFKQHRRGALLFFKVICQISRSHGTKKIADFDTNWGFLDCNSSSNSTMALKWYTKFDAV